MAVASWGINDKWPRAPLPAQFTPGFMAIHQADDLHLDVWNRIIPEGLPPKHVLLSSVSYKYNHRSRFIAFTWSNNFYIINFSNF